MMRFCANMVSRCVCVLDYIMHNDDTQARYSLANHVHNPRRAPVHLVHNTLRDRMNSLMRMYSRDS
jgi:hypothetical protein